MSDVSFIVLSLIVFYINIINNALILRNICYKFKFMISFIRNINDYKYDKWR